MAARTPPHLATLILLAGLSVLSLNMFLPSLANIAADFEADYALVNLSVSGYLAAMTVMFLIAGPMADRFGRRPVLLVALAVFAIASIGCALAEDVVTFLIFRILQCAVATGSSLSMAIVRDTTSRANSASLIGYMGMAMALAPLVGPMLGGFLDEWLGWRATFWFYAIAATGLLALSYVDLGETKRTQSSQAPQHDTLFTLLRVPDFWAYSLAAAFSTGVFYVFISGAPLVAARHFGVGAAELGIYIGSITGGFIFGNFLSGRYAARFAFSSMMIAGRLAALAGVTTGLFIVALADPAPFVYFGCTIFAGFGNGLTMPSANTGAISVREHISGSAAGLNSALKVALGALLTLLAGLILSANDAPWVLLAMMLTIILAGLTASIWARQIERRHPSVSEDVA